MKYYISYEWVEKDKKLSWVIHDKQKIIVSGFKTRKAARAYCDENGWGWVK